MSGGCAKNAGPTTGRSARRGIGTGRRVGTDNATPPSPNTTRYSVPVAPYAPNVSAVPVII